jgi:hypothetical protein
MAASSLVSTASFHEAFQPDGLALEARGAEGSSVRVAGARS